MFFNLLLQTNYCIYSYCVRGEHEGIPFFYWYVASFSAHLSSAIAPFLQYEWQLFRLCHTLVRVALVCYGVRLGGVPVRNVAPLLPLIRLMLPLMRL